MMIDKEFLKDFFENLSEQENKLLGEALKNERKNNTMAIIDFEKLENAIFQQGIGNYYGCRFEASKEGIGHAYAERRKERFINLEYGSPQNEAPEAWAKYALRKTEVILNIKESLITDQDLRKAEYKAIDKTGYPDFIIGDTEVLRKTLGALFAEYARLILHYAGKDLYKVFSHADFSHAMYQDEVVVFDPDRHEVLSERIATKIEEESIVEWMNFICKVYEIAAAEED